MRDIAISCDALGGRCPQGDYMAHGYTVYSRIEKSTPPSPMSVQNLYLIKTRIQGNVGAKMARACVGRR